MSTLEALSRDSIKEWLEADENTIYEQLGIRNRAIVRNPATAGAFDPHVTYDAHEMGALDDVRDLGRRIFRRWNKELNHLVCGADREDEGDRKKIRDTFGLGDAAIAGALTTVLVGSFGAAPAIATLIATLIVQRFMPATKDEVCKYWREKLAKS